MDCSVTSTLWAGQCGLTPSSKQFSKVLTFSKTLTFVFCIFFHEILWLDLLFQSQFGSLDMGQIQECSVQHHCALPSLRMFLCNTATDDIMSALGLAHLSHQEISQISGHILDIVFLNYLLLHSKTLFGKGTDWYKLMYAKCGIALIELQELPLGHGHITTCLRTPSKWELCLPVFIPVMQSSNNLPM